MNLLESYRVYCENNNKTALLGLLNNKLEFDSPDGNLQVAMTNPYTGRPGRWLSWWEVQSDINKITRVTHRLIAKEEIVLDLDPGEDESKKLFNLRIIATYNDIVAEGAIVLGIFSTGSRGAHIHTILPGLALRPKREIVEIKHKILVKFHADLAKSSSRSLIACECTRHWKTDRLKVMING